MCVAVGICSQLKPFSVGALVFYENEGCARILSIDSASQPPTYGISFVLGKGCGATDLERVGVKHADLELYDADEEADLKAKWDQLTALAAPDPLQIDLRQGGGEGGEGSSQGGGQGGQGQWRR